MRISDLQKKNQSIKKNKNQIIYLNYLFIIIKIRHISNRWHDYGQLLVLLIKIETVYNITRVNNFERVRSGIQYLSPESSSNKFHGRWSQKGPDNFQFLLRFENLLHLLLSQRDFCKICQLYFKTYLPDTLQSRCKTKMCTIFAQSTNTKFVQWVRDSFVLFSHLIYV